MSVDSCTVDTEDWQGADICTIGDVGGGVLGSEIASSGTDGAGYAYADLTLPGDANKQICGRITTWPASGTLYAYEDTSFTYVPAGDGTTSFQYQLYVDYIATGPVTTVPLNSGVAAATASGATLIGTSTIAPGAAQGGTSATATGATLTGASAISAGAATGGAAGTASGATLTGVSTINAGSAAGQVSATASGATLTGVSTIQAGTATGGAGSQAATAAGATLSGASTMVAGGASSAILIPNARQIHIGSPRVRLYTGGQMSFSPKRAGETEIFTVDYSAMLATGETIRTDAGHAPIWTATAAGSEDTSPNAIVQGAASVSGSKVSTLLTAGLPGVRYAPICTAQTSLGQTLVLPEYGQGQLEVTL